MERPHNSSFACFGSSDMQNNAQRQRHGANVQKPWLLRTTLIHYVTQRTSAEKDETHHTCVVQSIVTQSLSSVPRAAVENSLFFNFWP